MHLNPSQDLELYHAYACDSINFHDCKLKVHDVFISKLTAAAITAL